MRNVMAGAIGESGLPTCTQQLLRPAAIAHGTAVPGIILEYRYSGSWVPERINPRYLLIGEICFKSETFFA